MHGAGGGAPKGNSNAWKHGEAGAEARALHKEVAEMSRAAGETLAKLSG